jgi:hypothetical protein
VQGVEMDEANVLTAVLPSLAVLGSFVFATYLVG